MRISIAFLVAACFVSPAFAQEPGLFPLRDFITVELLPSADVVGPTVRLTDIARISGGTDRERDRLMRLDVDEIASGSAIVISRMQVELRLRLAGMSTNAFRVTGATKTQIASSRPELSEEAFIRAAAIAVADRLNMTPDRLNLRLAARFHRPYWTPGRGEQVRLDGRVLSAISANQPTKVEVDVVSKGQVRETVTIYVEMPVAPAGGVFPKESGGISDLGMRNPATALSGVAPGTMGVKMRDRVRLIIRVNSVLIQAVGEVEQDAGPGQMVRVRNIDSGRTVYGRLVDTGVVEITY